MRRFLFFLLLSASVQLPVRAWGNHALISYRALEASPELARAAPVAAEALEEFLRAQGPAIARLLDEQEAWAAREIRDYRPRPAALRFAPAADRHPDPERLRAGFLSALRVSPAAGFSLFLQIDPRHPPLDGGELTPQQLSSVPLSKGATQRFVALQAGQWVAPLAVVASASDEPDYGYDIDLFDDNPGGGGLGFGRQPFGNPALRVSSQAPFHMGFFHQGGVFNALAPALARSFVQLRVQQYSGLAVLAFRTGHAYWGWRFSGLAMHYVQDLAQPYHASAAPGARLPAMVWANLLAQLGFPERKAGLIVLQSNRHFLLETYQTRLLLAAAQAQVDTANERALRDTRLDAGYPAWSPHYLRDVVAREAFEAGPGLDAAIVVGAPARYVTDPGFDFGAAAGIDLDADMRRQLQAQRDAMQAATARLLGNAGAHSRNLLRGVLSQAR